MQEIGIAVGQKDNAIIGLYVGVAALLLLAGVVFAVGSYFIAHTKGKVAAYYLSQFLSVAFILIAVILLVLRAASLS